MLNEVILIGRLTRDPELRYTKNNTPAANFTVASDRPFKTNGQQEADFIPVIAWRKSAENCAKYLKKGSLVAVTGRIQTRRYMVDDQTRYITEVVANTVKFLPSGKRQETPLPEEPPGQDFYPIEEDDDELPF